MTENYYMTCRKSAGYSREEAAFLLNIAVTTLQNYETMKAVVNEHGEKTVRVPEEIVDGMARLYGNKSLVDWHIRNSMLGKYLPRQHAISSYWEMGFYVGVARDALCEAEEIVRQIASDYPFPHYDGRHDQFVARVDTASTLTSSIMLFANTDCKIIA